MCLFGRWPKSNCRRFAVSREGAVAAEFALAVPVLLVLLSGMIDYGMALNQSAALSNAARAGAQYAVRFPSDTAGIRDVVTKSVNFAPETLTISAGTLCECADGAAIACTDSCGGEPARTFITVKVSMPFTSPLPTQYLLGLTEVSGMAVFRAN